MPDAQGPSLSHRLEYAAYAAARTVFERLRLDRGTAIAAAIARSASPILRPRAMRNLQLAMPEFSEREHRLIVTGMTDHLVRVMIEYLHLPELRDDPSRITIHGEDHLTQARAAGRGAVLVTGHLGNWEAVRAACARLDWTPAIIYRQFNNHLIDDEALRYMRTLDAPIFQKGRRGTLGLLRHVRKGGAVMILTDQRSTRSPDVPFFNRPAKTSLSPAELAKEHGAALLPVRGIRRGRTSTFDVTIDAPLQIGMGDTAAIDAMTDINLRLESWIRETPEQYFWLHNRWGTKAFNT